MNGRVAHRARLILLRLVVERGNSRRPGIRGKRVTFQTKEVYLRALQQSRIGGAVRRMAGRAAFYLHDLVFIHERSRFVRVTLETNLVLRSRSPQLPGQESAMRIVAIGALHQAFVHSMVEWPVELLVLVEMAAVAQRRLLSLEQEVFFFCMVRIVTIRTAYSVLQVYRPREVAVLLAILVAIQTTRTDLLC